MNGKKAKSTLWVIHVPVWPCGMRWPVVELAMVEVAIAIAALTGRLHIPSAFLPLAIWKGIELSRDETRKELQTDSYHVKDDNSGQ